MRMEVWSQTVQQDYTASPGPQEGDQAATFRLADLNGDGVLDLHEFCLFMTLLKGLRKEPAPQLPARALRCAGVCWPVMCSPVAVYA